MSRVVKKNLLAVSAVPVWSANPAAGPAGETMARRTRVKLTFSGVDITDSIEPYLISVQYADSEEDEADDLQLMLHDRPSVWLQSWIQRMMIASVTDAPAQVLAGGTQAAASAGTYTVTAQSGLILRAGPGIDTARLGCFPYGTDVSVSDNSGTWFQVSVGGQSGYMHSGYLKPKEAAAAGQEAASGEAADAQAQQTAPQIGGFKIAATIVREGWNDGLANELECGQFELDTIQCQGPPDTLTIKATALPFSADIRQTKKDKAWEGVKLSDIGKEIAAAAGMAFMFISETDILYAHKEQKEKADIVFLSELCHDAGLSLKATNNMIVVFDQIARESAASIQTIRKGDGSYTKHTLSTSKAGKEYQSCRVSYLTPEGQLIEGVAKLADYDPEAKGNQQLEIRMKVDSIGEAQLLAQKHLRLHNKYQKTATFSMQGNTDLVAGVCVVLEGWGPWSGKYIVKNAKHQVAASSGYTTTITLRRVLGGY